MPFYPSTTKLLAIPTGSHGHKPAFPFCPPGQSQYTSNGPLVAVLVGLFQPTTSGHPLMSNPLLCSENENREPAHFQRLLRHEQRHFHLAEEVQIHGEIELEDPARRKERVG